MTIPSWKTSRANHHPTKAQQEYGRSSTQKPQQELREASPQKPQQELTQTSLPRQSPSFLQSSYDVHRVPISPQSGSPTNAIEKSPSPHVHRVPISPQSGSDVNQILRSLQPNRISLSPRIAHKSPTPAHALPLTKATVRTSPRQAPSSLLRQKIVQIVGAIESKNNYSAINQNPSGGGIAYGTLQVLSRTGGLHQLLQRYAVAGGTFARDLLAFGNSTSAQIANSKDFQRLLQQAGTDPIMQMTQRQFFAQTYLQPAITFGQQNKLRLPASYLILFDTFIHYGTDKDWLRQKITSLIQRYGEKQGMKTFLQWMRRSLYRSYSRRYGANSIEARYNVWRADFLSSMLQRNPYLTGNITIHAPQWRKAIRITHEQGTLPKKSLHRAKQSPTSKHLP